jgi:hypothetical protein
LSRDLIKLLPKSIQPGGFKGDSSRHGMTSVAKQQVAALAEGIRQVETRDAASGSTQQSAIAADDYGWTIELLQHS